MCGPLAVAAIPAAVSAAGQIVNFMGQQKAASQNTTAANLTYAANQNADAERATQIDQQQSENTVNAMIAKAAASGKVSADASSFGGDSQTAARADNADSFSIGQQLGREDINSQNQRLQTANDETSNFIARQSQINRVPAPNPLALGISIAGDAAGGLGAYIKARQPNMAGT